VEILVPPASRSVHVPLRNGYILSPKTRPMGAGRALTGQRKDGTQFPVEISLSPFETGQGTLVTSIIRDITDLQRAQEQIRVRDEFISIASHELKTPLTSLKLQVQTMLRRLLQGKADVEDPMKLQKLLQLYSGQVDRLTRLVEDMLDISRISNGRLTLDKQDMDLKETVELVLERYREQLHMAQVVVRTDLRTGVRGHWDRMRMEQVITNLLTNVIKYAPGSPIDVRLHSSDQNAHLSIQDRGQGIPKEAQERIFNRFERATPKYGISGLGLGLYIVQHILGLHGGSIRVDSEPGQGATFTIELPFK
jgi:two-component system, LuxR family, sensor kinase FixL